MGDRLDHGDRYLSITERRGVREGSSTDGPRVHPERAERIIYEERVHFDGWLVALQAVPTIRDLRRRAESIRQSELDRFGGRLRLDPGQEETVAQLTWSIVNKLMHAPIARLRAETDREVFLHPSVRFRERLWG